MTRISLVSAAFLALPSAAALAGIPDAGLSTVEPWTTMGHVLVSPGTGAASSRVDSVVIVVRETSGQPRPGSQVRIRFQDCAALCFESSPSLSNGFTYDPATHTYTAFTNFAGRVVLDLPIGGCDDCQVEVSSEGAPLRFFPRVVSPDWDGVRADGIVDCADAEGMLAHAVAQPACFDLDGSGQVDAADQAIRQAATLAGDRNPHPCGTTASTPRPELLFATDALSSVNLEDHSDTTLAQVGAPSTTISFDLVNTEDVPHWSRFSWQVDGLGSGVPAVQGADSVLVPENSIERFAFDVPTSALDLGEQFLCHVIRTCGAGFALARDSLRVLADAGLAAAPLSAEIVLEELRGDCVQEATTVHVTTTGRLDNYPITSVEMWAAPGVPGDPSPTWLPLSPVASGEGEQEASIVRANYPSPGSFSVPWDPVGQPGGEYLLRTRVVDALGREANAVMATCLADSLPTIFFSQPPSGSWATDQLIAEVGKRDSLAQARFWHAKAVFDQKYASVLSRMRSIAPLSQRNPAVTGSDKPLENDVSCAPTSALMVLEAMAANEGEPGLLKTPGPSGTPLTRPQLMNEMKKIMEFKKGKGTDKKKKFDGFKKYLTARGLDARWKFEEVYGENKLNQNYLTTKLLAGDRSYAFIGVRQVGVPDDKAVGHAMVVQGVRPYVQVVGEDCYVQTELILIDPFQNPATTVVVRPDENLNFQLEIPEGKIKTFKINNLMQITPKPGGNAPQPILAAGNSPTTHVEIPLEEGWTRVLEDSNVALPWMSLVPVAPDSAGTVLWYRARVADPAGHWTEALGFAAVVGPISVIEPAPTPRTDAWIAPNPFDTQTTIHFLPRSRFDLEVDVYDARGRHVRSLVKERSTLLTEREVVWDRLDETGTPVGAGIYFVRVSSGLRAENKKVVLIR